MKIAISGAGIAGPTLAYWLMRGGHEPTIIEKAPRLRTGGYMIDFWGTGYSVAEKMGILPAIMDAGYSVQEVRYVDRGGRRAASFSTDVFQSMTKGRFTSLPRSELAKAIYCSLDDRAETIFDEEISKIEQHGSSLRVRFEHSPPRDFDLVVGADGQHSRVRQLVFGPENQFERHLGYHVAAFEFDGYRPRQELVYVCRSTPGRQIARFAQRDDRTMFLFVFASELMGEEPQNARERKEALRHVFEGVGWEVPQILRAMEQAEEIYFDRVSQIRMDHWSNGRVILIGDAATCVSLLAGQGSSLAMTEAYVLAGELSHSGCKHADAFAQYERRMRSLIESKQKSALNFAGAFAPKTRLGVWFRNQIAKLLALRPIADYFVGRDLSDDFDLPQYEM